MWAEPPYFSIPLYWNIHRAIEITNVRGIDIILRNDSII
jgi:hypothetical protein